MRILLSCLCIALALLLGAASAARADLTVCSSPDCEVSNHIDTDRTWKAATYRVQEHIQVRPGVRLTLEPGVTLQFTAPEMGLRVAGTLIARGTGDNEGQRITFTSGQIRPVPGDWGTILFTETAVGASFDGTGNHIGGSIFEHCVVEYAGGGGALGAIWAQSPRAPYVYRSTIRDNDASGVRLEGPPDSGGHSQGAQEARVRQSEILRNRLGDGGGVYVVVSASGTAALAGNTLSGNSATRDGGGIFLRVGPSATATLSANTLLGNSAGRDGGGIHLSAAGTVTLSGNPLLSGNSAGRDGGGISLWVEPSGAATLSDNNTLSGNSAGRDGGGLHLFAAGTVSIRENRISYNTAPRQGGGIHVRQGQPTLSRNDLLGNAPLQLGNGSRAGTPHLDARDNWWGTANEAEIQRGIWDGKDDPALGVVDWQPYLAAPVFSNHPPSPSANPSPADGIGEVVRNPTLSWSAGTDFEPGDTVSYDVYFGVAADPPPVSEGQTVPSYTPPALLKRNTWHSWRVVARDSRGEETWGPRWRFRTVSSPFLLSPIGNKTVNEGQALSFTLLGNSPGGAPLTFSASNLPSGASFDPIARRFSWTPTRDQAGTYPGVRFSVTNGTYTDSEEITLTVVDVP